MLFIHVKVIEQSVLFTIPHNDWNESEGNSVGEEEQGTCHHGNHEGTPLFGPLHVM